MVKGRGKHIAAAFAAAALCAALAPAAALAADAPADKPELASEKSETVRVIADASGTPIRVEVDTTLYNAQRAAQLVDDSDLTGITPKEDSGTFTEKSGELIWQADGENVAYKGETDKSIPVKVKVTYTLDGKQVAPEDLAGASGHVVVRYDYENTAVVDGTATPFTMISALLLDDERFSNVKATNGKVITDEGRTIVVGYALPGMQESLELSKDDRELPAYFEFEADVNDFELNASLTMASTDLFNDFKREDFDTAELSDSAGELSSALGKIIDATSEFKNGLGKLDEGAKTLADALASLKNKIPVLANAISMLASGSTDLKDGLDQVVGKLTLLDQGASGITGGLDAIINGDGATNPGMAYIAGSAYTLATGVSAINDGIGGLLDQEKGLPKLKAAADAIVAQLNDLKNSLGDLAGLSAALGQVESSTSDASGKASSAYATLAALLNDTTLTQNQKQAIESAMADAQQAAQSAGTANAYAQQINGAVASLSDLPNQVGQLSDAIQGISGGIGEAIGGLGELRTGAQEASNGASNLAYGLNELLEGLNTLYDASKELASGITTRSDEKEGLPAAATGAGDLASGLNKLDESTGEMQQGVDQLAEGASNLQKGTEESEKGAGELLDGLQTYNDEGISELVNKIDVELQGYIDRFFASRDLGKAYDNFTGKAEGTPSSVKFVYEIAGIGTETE